VTGTNGNAASITVLTPYTTSFTLVNGEFAYVAKGTSFGFNIGGAARASISSSTFHHGWDGLFIASSSSSSVNRQNILITKNSIIACGLSKNVAE
jgi:hypothetical protein